uniref:Uncharacterized protein n=1 Tax=Aegilops tauschii subsp. strangulata TaxID=200361 RepID=A0A453JXV4_AEGTS
MIAPLGKCLANQNVTPLITAAIRGRHDVANLLLERDSGLLKLSKANGTTIFIFLVQGISRHDKTLLMPLCVPPLLASSITSD